jgi:hypothetical protein
MIRANLRQRLTAEDFQLAIDLLGQGRPAGSRYFEGLMAEEGPDQLLDQPGLPDLLRGARGMEAPSAPLFFYVLVRHGLRESGIDDTRLSDYLGSLVMEFGLRDRAHRIAAHDDESRHYLVDLVGDLRTARGQRAFLTLAHLGNFSLWLAGIFPDYIAARSARNGAPDVRYYDELGARGFRMAAGHGMARDLDLDDLYAFVADAFPRIRGVLNRLSERTLFRAA